ncbi:MAG: hypothetical protein K6G22_14920 [Lachnospiraceae bacterium]|nr:hypothetical protein [Lachnospiraceae bacterium]
MKRRTSGTSLFLMELIISIMFFSVACAVCVQSFVTSKILDDRTRELNASVNIAQGLCDAMRGTDGSIYGITAVYRGAVIGEDDSYFQLYFDKHFKSVGPMDQSAVYVCDVSLEDEPGSSIEKMNVVITDLKEFKEIYSLSATKYLPDAY